MNQILLICFILIHFIPNILSTYELSDKRIFSRLQFDNIAVTDSFGKAIHNLPDMDNDGNEDMLISAPGKDEVYLCLLTSTRTISTYFTISNPSPTSSAFGTGLTTNIDDTGSVDIVIGAPEHNNNQGAVYVYDVTTSTANLFDYNTPFDLSTSLVLTDNDFFGRSVEIGDFDDDEINDLIVGAPGRDIQNINEGSIFIIYLNGDNTKKSSYELNSTSQPSLTFATNLNFGKRLSSDDIDGDGLTDIIVGWPDYDTTKGMVLILSLDPSNNISWNSYLPNTSSITLTTGDYFGSSVSALDYDIDSNGFNDIIVGAKGDSVYGAIYLLLLKANGNVESYAKMVQIDDDYLSVTALGSDLFSYGSDINSDGLIDIGISSPKFGGRVILVNLGDSTTPAPTLTTSPTVTQTTFAPSTHSPTETPLLNTDSIEIVAMSKIEQYYDGGTFVDIGLNSVAYIVIDQDGDEEIIIGDIYANANKGAIHILYMWTDGTISHGEEVSSTANSFTVSLTTTSHFGSCIDVYTDTDDNDILIVGAKNQDNKGALYFLKFSDTVLDDGSSVSLDLINQFAFGIVPTGSEFATDVLVINDIDGDDIDDIIVTAPSYGPTNNGKVYILYMDTNFDIKNFDYLYSTTSETHQYFGTSITHGGGDDQDLTGDGYIDIIIGVPGNQEILIYNENINNSNYDSISSTSFTATILLTAKFGSSVSTFGKNNGDRNGDGINDIMVGAPGANSGQGAIYILFLNSMHSVNTWINIQDNSFTGLFLSTGDYFGSDIICFDDDINSDGFLDIGIIASQETTSPSQGSLYILSLAETSPTSLSPTKTPNSSPNSTSTTFSPTKTPITIIGTVEVSGFHEISQTEGSFIATLYPGDYFGSALTIINDINNDNMDDLIVSAPNCDDENMYSGCVYIIALSTSGLVSDYWKISNIYGSFQSTLTSYDYFGSSLTPFDDLDGDSIPDIAVGAIGDDDGWFDSGAIYMIALQTSGLVKTFIKISSTEGSFAATLGTTYEFGSSISSLKDVDNDSIDDIGVGAMSSDNYKGSLYLIMLKADLTVKTYIKISSTSGGLINSDITYNDYFGVSISLLGGQDDDLDNDGVYDIMSGAYGKYDLNMNSGSIYILYMKTDNTIKTHVKISNTSGSLTVILDTRDTFGWSLSSFGRWSNADIDGDGAKDILVGAPGDNTYVVAIYIIMLNTWGTVKTYSKISSTEGNFNATLNTADTFGKSISSFGSDIDYDGYIDIAVGSDRMDSDTGGLYILSLNSASPTSTTLSPTLSNTITSPASTPTTGSPTKTPITITGTIQVSSSYKISYTQGLFTAFLDTYDYFGYSLTTINDINNDNIDDLIVSAAKYDDAIMNSGCVYVIFLLTSGEVNTFIKISQTSGSFMTVMLNADDYFGSSLTSFDDLDNDSIPDIAVGAIGDDDGNTNSGCIYIIALQTSGLVKTFIKISSTEGSFNITLYNTDTFGSSLTSLKDIDSDGMNDVGVGASRNDDGSWNVGAIYLIMLKTSSKVKTYIKISNTSGGFTNSGLVTNDQFGSSISLLGGYDDDLDNDGVYDIMSGADNKNDMNTYSGSIYILFMKTNNTVKTFVKISNTSGSFTVLLVGAEYFGSSLSSFGRWSNSDIDGDNIQDILVGASGSPDGGSHSGSIYIIMLETNGLVKTYSQISSSEGSFNGLLDIYDTFGKSISSFGKDITNDGLIDIVVGAEKDDDSYTDSGAIYILSLSGQPTSSPTTSSPTTSSPTTSSPTTSSPTTSSPTTSSPTTSSPTTSSPTTSSPTTSSPTTSSPTTSSPTTSSPTTSSPATSSPTTSSPTTSSPTTSSPTTSSPTTSSPTTSSPTSSSPTNSPTIYPTMAPQVTPYPTQTPTTSSPTSSPTTSSPTTSSPTTSTPTTSSPTTSSPTTSSPTTSSPTTSSPTTSSPTTSSPTTSSPTTSSPTTSTPTTSSPTTSSPTTSSPTTSSPTTSSPTTSTPTTSSPTTSSPTTSSPTTSSPTTSSPTTSSPTTSSPTTSSTNTAAPTPTKPNIIVILTDDQDYLLGSLDRMVHLNAKLIDRGLQFTNAFTHAPVCCPSRASLMTGTYIHNHHVTNSSQAGNCYSPQWRATSEQNNIGLKLNNLGYTTWFGGKYLNQYGKGLAGDDGVDVYPPGWSDWYGMVGNAAFYDYSISNNGIEEVYGTLRLKDYFPDVLKNHTFDLIDNHFLNPNPDPFFLYLALVEPHEPAEVAKANQDRFPNLKAPRTDAYNDLYSDKPFISKNGGIGGDMSTDEIKASDTLYRRRILSLISTDTLVDDLIDKLTVLGILDNTYLFFTSDHGFHHGQYGLPFGKRLPYEVDLRVPLIVRGPGITEGTTDDTHAILNLDIAPTIFEIAGGDLSNENFDGNSFYSLLGSSTSESFDRYEILITHNGEGGRSKSAKCDYQDLKCRTVSVKDSTYKPKGVPFTPFCLCYDAPNNTYDCIRTLNETHNTLYCEYHKTDFIEYYDISIDPYNEINSFSILTNDEKNYYHDRLWELIGCQGVNECDLTSSNNRRKI